MQHLFQRHYEPNNQVARVMYVCYFGRFRFLAAFRENIRHPLAKVNLDGYVRSVLNLGNDVFAMHVSNFGFYG